MKKTTCLILFYLMVPFLVYMSANTPHHYQLDNGLNVVILNDSNASIVSVKTFVNVGSIYEDNYQGTGISHYLEHLVAGGSTTKQSEDDYKEALSLLGGVSNAYTTTDHTSYFINTTPENTKKALTILYEWMFYCKLNPTEVDREKKVITREIEKNNASSSRQFYQLSQKNTYKSHPTRLPVIGYLEKFKTITKKDLELFYKKHYIPSNITLVIAGPLNIKKTKTLITNTFATQPVLNKPLHPSIIEKKPLTKRSQEHPLNIKTTMISLRFHTIDLQHPDLYALDLLDYILGNGNQSILHKKIVDELKLAYSISTVSYTPHYADGYFEVLIEADYHNKDAVIMETLKQLENCKYFPFPKALVEKAKKQKISENILNISSVEDKANRLGLSVVYAETPTFFETYIENFTPITASNIQDAANTYFNKDLLITTIAYPKDEPGHNTEKKASKSKSLNKKITLDNGLRILLHPQKDLPKVRAQIMTLASITTESDKTNGIRTIIASLLGKETSNLNKEQIETTFENNGAYIQGNSGNHTVYYTLDCLSEDFDTLFKLFLNTYVDAKFPESELKESKRKAIHGIKQRDDDWYRSNYYTFKKQFWGSHPYSRPLSGEIDSINSLTKETLTQYFQSIQNPKTTIISIYGDFNEKNTLKTIDSISKTFNTKKAPPTPTIKPTKHKHSLDKKSHHKHDVTTVFMGFNGISLKNSEEKIKLDLVDAILTGLSYPGGRLHNKLRDKGFVYLVHGINFAGLDDGLFYIYALTNEKNSDDVKTLIASEINSIKTKKVSEKEFNEAIERMKFYYKERLSSSDNYMLLNATDELYHNNFEHYKDIEPIINKLNIKDVQKTAKKYLNNPQTISFHKK